MSEIKISLRYAKSLLDIAKEQNKVEQINNDVKLLSQTLRVNHQLQAILGNPIISIDNKKKILQSIFNGKVDNVLLSFFDLIIGKGRGAYLYSSANQFSELYNQLKGIVKAEIVSATALSEVNKNAIQASLEKELGKQVVLNTKVDAALIGGFVLTVGDKQFDASISKQLKSLKTKLTNNNLVA
ncbi:ATP synthase F1 subunit delta [Solitalea lacus]|uniref:ATP synthase F1 subunit delta n=1 Tax=Solitalea lacus TaxID=2911172 RepID=UPI001EDBECCF|nr:ATP synthase F1 subunit delta [Solitalea lacus]UKJ07328.1 ATP synthase F1 subunit delta [Solitalea lacus]